VEFAEEMECIESERAMNVLLELGVIGGVAAGRVGCASRAGLGGPDVVVMLDQLSGDLEVAFHSIQDC
jgi:hypothetical protein